MGEKLFVNRKVRGQLKSEKRLLVVSMAGGTSCCDVGNPVDAIGFKFTNNQILTKSNHLKVRQDVIDGKESWKTAAKLLI